MIESANQYILALAKKKIINPSANSTRHPFDLKLSISNTNSLGFGYHVQISVLKSFIFICTNICIFQQAKKIFEKVENPISENSNLFIYRNRISIDLEPIGHHGRPGSQSKRLGKHRHHKSLSNSIGLTQCPHHSKSNQPK
jgi:hypothetical protein